MQFRHESGLTAEEYVSRQAWREASAPACLRGGSDRCGLYGHGTYGRKFPVGMRVARWYCAYCRVAPSALPDCLSARLPGSLAEAEAVASFAEDHGIHAAARRWRADAADDSSARRWVRRRVLLVRECLTIFRGLEPILLLGVALTVGAAHHPAEGPDGNSCLMVVEILKGPRFATAETGERALDLAFAFTSE